MKRPRFARPAVLIVVTVALAGVLWFVKESWPSWRIARLDDRWSAALDSGDPASALPLIEKALSRRRELFRHEPRELAFSLNEMALGLLNRCSPPATARTKAERLLREVFNLARGNDEEAWLLRAASLESLSGLARDRGAWSESERQARQAMYIYQKLYGEEDLSVLDGLLPLAAVIVDQGRYGEGERLFRRALQIVRQPGPDTAWPLARVYNELGDLLLLQGRHAEAEGAFENARSNGLKILREEDLFFALVANNLARLYKDKGEYFQAEQRLRRSLELRQNSPQACPYDVANAKLNMGEIYRLQGEYERAEPYYKEALEEASVALEETRPDLLPYFYNQYALFYVEQGMLDEAGEYYSEALRRTRSALGSRHPLVAQVLHDMADLEQRRGRPAEAQRLYRQALNIREGHFGPHHPDVAATLIGLSSSLFHSARPAEALVPLERALAAFRRTSVYPEIEAEAYELRAALRRGTGDRQGALEDLRTSLEIIEDLRPRTGGGEQARTRFLERYADWFHRMIQWEVEAGRIDQAFEFAERSRARLLLDQLLAARVDFLGSIPDAAKRQALSERRSAAQARLAEAQRRISVVQADRRPRKAASDNLSSLFSEREQAETELQALEDEIRNESPLWQTAARNESISLSRAQSRLVPVDGLLLLYEIGPEESFLFEIPEAGQRPQVHALEISSGAATVLKVEPGPLTRQKLEVSLLGPTGRNGILRRLGEPPSRNPRTLADRQESLAAGLHALWTTLVPTPVWERVRESSQVLLIPDGLLHRLPFEALVVEPGLQDFDRALFWIDPEGGPPLRYSASVTSLAALSDRARNDASGGASVLSVSDPAFSPDPGGGTTAQGHAQMTRGEYERAGGSLARLPWTAAETEALLDVFGSAASYGEVLALRGREAVESRVRVELAGKRYIHLATHGLVDQRPGSLFAALALTPPGRGGATAHDDGFLQLYEIYSMKLDCRLAVLSACRTAFGASMEGEGVFSLSRGFLVAGARRVIASLWQVSDKATAELMENYFRRIASAEAPDAQAPPDYAEALWLAKREVSRAGEGARRDPYFWAPFILSGED